MMKRFEKEINLDLNGKGKVERDLAMISLELGLLSIFVLFAERRLYEPRLRAIPVF